MANLCKTTRARALAYVTLGGVVSFLCTTGVLHWLQPGLNPLTEAVSYYVHGVGGWLLTIGLLSLGAGSLALTAALGTGERVSRAGLWCLAVWSVGVILGGTFAADPPGHWDRPPSLSGSIHGGAAMVAFMVFPVAAVLLSCALGSKVRWAELSGVLALIAKASAVSLVIFMSSLAPVFVRPGPPILLGVTERIALAVYATWLGVAAAGVLKAAVTDSTRPAEQTTYTAHDSAKP